MIFAYPLQSKGMEWAFEYIHPSYILCTKGMDI